MNKIPVVFHPSYDVSSESSSRVPLGKYIDLKELLKFKGIISTQNLFIPTALSSKNIKITHEYSYVERVALGTLSDSEKRIIGLPSINRFCKRAFIASSGTLLASRLAIKSGLVAANLAGGSHHASTSAGSGFCIFNDVAVALNCLLVEGLISNAIVLDLDVHQGDGTAEIFSNNNRVFTVSVHCEKNFPTKKIKSDLDLGLEVGTSDEFYLKKLKKILQEIMYIPADILIYNAGVDIHEDDYLGFLKVSKAGITARENLVLDFVKKRRLPLVITLGGGYQKNIAKLSELHSIIFEETLSRFKLN